MSSEHEFHWMYSFCIKCGVSVESHLDNPIKCFDGDNIVSLDYVRRKRELEEMFDPCLQRMSLPFE